MSRMLWTACRALLLALPLSAFGASPCLQAALPAGWPSVAHAGQVLISAGQVSLGSDHGYADERPAAEPTRVDAFWMDRTEVNNTQFASFARATAYVTDAERQGAAAVFAVPTAQALQSQPLAWWKWVNGANWRHPGGPGTDLRGKERLPVVHVTRADALAYARWLGRDLPTEAEWEYAAKAGQSGDSLDAAPRDARSRPAANYWQGNFPLLNTREDGHAGLAPVACYAPNAWGLYDMIGNAWEWTKDPYRGPHQGHANGDPALLIKAQAALGRVDAPERAVIKGGSFLCSPEYCVRYRASARESQEPDMPTAHVGFRTITRLTPSASPKP